MDQKQQTPQRPQPTTGGQYDTDRSGADKGYDRQSQGTTTEPGYGSGNQPGQEQDPATMKPRKPFADADTDVPNDLDES